MIENLFLDLILERLGKVIFEFGHVFAFNIITLIFNVIFYMFPWKNTVVLRDDL